MAQANYKGNNISHLLPVFRSLSACRHRLYNTTMQFSTIFFDLDETLYEKGNGLWNAIGNRMNQFMIDRLGMPPDEIGQLRQKYFEEYGTTLRGLQLHYKVDAEEYLNYVHDLPLEKFLQPDPKLNELLSSINVPGWIFTNSDIRHASRVIQTLGLEQCFKGIIDIYALDYYCKPQAEAYWRALEIAGQPEPETCIFLDDSYANLKTASILGMTTVLVGTDFIPSPEVNFGIKNMLDLPEVIPHLWEIN